MRIVKECAPFEAEVTGLDTARLQPSDAAELKAFMRCYRFPAHVQGRVSFLTTEPNEYISGWSELGFHSDFSFYDDGAGKVLSLYAIRANVEDPTVFAE